MKNKYQAIKNWFKTLFSIVGKLSEIDQYLNHLNREVVRVEKIIRDRTEVAVDISPYGYDHTTVLVMGRYRNRDYMETFTLPPDEMHNTIQRLKDIQRQYGQIKHIDASPSMRFVGDILEDDWKKNYE